MSKKVLGLITIILVLVLCAASSQSVSVSAQGEATPAATKEAKENEAANSPFCTTTSAASTTASTAADATPVATAEAKGPTQQPHAARIAAGYGVSYEEVIGWFCKGYGLGQVEIAYAIASASAKTSAPLTVAQLFTMRDAGQGWGQIVKSANLSMRDVQQARRMARGKAPKNKEHGNGNGNGQGNGKGNGKGNEQGNGDKADDDD
jgi:hypothetical protein